jgi:hypothetical protein
VAECKSPGTGERARTLSRNCWPAGRFKEIEEAGKSARYLGKPITQGEAKDGIRARKNAEWIWEFA